jgi:hypothetical protein
MSSSRQNRPVARPRLVIRILLWLSTSKQIDGLWVGAATHAGEIALDRVVEALGLIKTHDRHRYNRLLRDLERIWVQVIPGGLASFTPSLWCCDLDPRFVLAPTSTPEIIAAAIVHEGTHARFWRCGIGYEEGQRHRVEAACLRRELAFAARLPNGTQARENAERCLTEYPPSFWTDAAFSERSLDNEIQAVRYLGMPDWVVRLVLAARDLRLGLRRFANRLRSASCRSQ